MSSSEEKPDPAGMAMVRILLKARRESMELSARTVSERAGLSPSYVNKVETGQLSPSLKAFSSITDVLKFNPREVEALCRMARW